MNIEQLRAICTSLPGVTEDIKWGNDLCFCIGGKMFCVAGIGESPVSASFKVRDDQFDEMAVREGFRPAPYVAKYKWVLADDLNRMTPKDWEYYVEQSYGLVREKLSAKIRKELQLITPEK